MGWQAAITVHWSCWVHRFEPLGIFRGDVRNSLADTSLIRQCLEYDPSCTVAEELTEAAKWHVSQLHREACDRGCLDCADVISTFAGQSALTPVAGRPLLGYPLDRLRHCGLDLRIVLATSLDSSDDPLEEFAEAEGIDCVRGSLDDVAVDLLKQYKSLVLKLFLESMGIVHSSRWRYSGEL
ncbi:MAG: hypothetical protein R3F19_28565 [Verrucomicrobiales bacterium]